MNAPLLERRYTLEEFERLPDTHGVELLDGRLVEKAMGLQSSVTAANLIGFLVPFVTQQQLGVVSGADGGFQLSPKRPNFIRKPDVSFVRRDRLTDGEVPEGDCRFPPDLAAEVVSKNDNALDLEEKSEEYLNAGVPLIWVLYPRTKSVYVYRHDGSVARLREDGELSGENVVPGFRCRVGDLFPAS